MGESRTLLWLSSAMGVISIFALVVLFVMLSGLRGEHNALVARIDENAKTVAATLGEKQKLIDGIRGDVGKNKTSIDVLRQDLSKLQSEFATLKADLAGAAAKSITKEIIDAATTQAITQAVQQFASTNSGQKFIEQLAKELASNHQAKLAGSPGKDADDERIAAFLSARADFVDSVSVSILQLQEGRGK